MLYYFALLSLLISFLLTIYNWKLEKNTLFIAGIMVILSAHGLTHYFSDPTQSDFSLALLFGTLTPFWLVPGPLLHFYFRSILTPEKAKITSWDLLHFIPFFIQLANIAPYLVTSWDYKLQIAHSIHQNLNNLNIINVNSFSTFKTSFLSRPILMLGYLLWCTLFLLQQITQTNLRTRNWLIFVLFSLFIITSAYLVVALNLFSTSFSDVSINENPIYFSSGIVYIIFPIALIFIYPEVLYGIKKVYKQSFDVPKEISKEELTELKDLANRIQNYLHKEKPYLNPSFEIADVTRALNVPQKQISLACKYANGKKFTELRSSHRINHAKALLHKGLTDNITIDAIGTISGFKSRSTFYEAFKAETGMTPSQYLESL
ncbi:helix-turn-helix domain-containing protein [Aquirufa sp. HETE-83D]|uniref:Helix-turn-helix domain-containing protein n=1 Tax=Aquirufa esocilacus TaxID=3096513 RepID=A0ABW6DLE0_9BACT